jgi:nucleotide-binding universal stress UspA family protein
MSAIKVALQLGAAIPDSRLVALHVVNVRASSGNFLGEISGRIGFEPAVVPPEMAKARQLKGERLVHGVEAEARALGVDVESHVVTGVVSATLLKHAEGADLVVMGLKGSTEDKFEGQGGEMATWLAPKSTAPVLLVPRRQEAITGIAVGYDGSNAAKHALRMVRDIASALDLPVHGVFVSKGGADGTATLDELDTLLEDIALERHVVNGPRAHQALVEAAGAFGANLLVVGYTGRSPFRDLFFGSSTERILLEAKLAVLVAR